MPWRHPAPSFAAIARVPEAGAGRPAIDPPRRDGAVREGEAPEPTPADAPNRALAA